MMPGLVPPRLDVLGDLDVVLGSSLNLSFGFTGSFYRDTHCSYITQCSIIPVYA